MPDKFDPCPAPAGDITGVVDHHGRREQPMQERSFSTVRQPPGGADPPTDTPIYDAVERLWLQHGREVPHAPAPRPERHDDDLFHRA
ncbi:hypothetical protein J7E97_19625 [Streptomyces sp. ISL-66]|uniref:hypothetical protein n=1 Tax=Streptomyces sp. ISL-66 TaxID=2819186 RepID=UPI001BEBD8FC|nr:hypothetical protein [Streptomyces sp. ISL-66]MBT2470024.1 hypothetical protein [Streptomyces sp. ISL-66]